LSSTSKPVVALTGLEGRDNPYPGVAIASALREARGEQITLVGLSYDPTLTGNFRADLFDRVYSTPLPGDPAAVLLRRLFEIHDEYPIDVLIPALDSELAIFALHREKIAERGIKMVIPSPEAVKSRYKQRLYRWARERSIFSPRTEVVTDPKTFWEQEEWSFPCYLKGPLADALRVESLDEAIAVYHRLAARWGYPVLAQEIIHGTEYDVCAVAAPGGASIGAICLRKTILSRAGKGIGAEVVDSPEALAAAERVLEALRWEGPLEIEMIRETSSGRFFLLEVNARFPAWIGIAPATGLNLPDLLLALALGEELPEERTPRIGTRFLRGSKTTISDVRQLGRLLASGRLLLRDE
jgi:carbamoyl-phosphate synthase large subunit